jgi:hypothetical protein
VSAYSMEESRIANETLFEKLASRDANLIKQAQESVDDFTRTRMREDGFFRKIIPPLPISNSQLTRTTTSDKPMVVIDRESDSPAAISIPFATLPMNLYIRGSRYAVMFDRITTPRFTKDVDELRTWIMDIRQVLSDNAIKDMLAEEDSKFIRAVNTAIVGPGLIVPTSGTVQHAVMGGGVSRNSLWESLKVMPNTPSSLEVHTCLINNITIKDVGKFSHNEMGGTLAEDLMRNGWSLQTFLGKQWIITIKKGLVPTGTVYQFADPNFIGKSFTLEDVTMYIRREAYMLEFFSYSTMGATIGNTSGVCRVDFNG